MTRLFNSLPAFWLILAIPAAMMLRAYVSGETIAMDLLHPSGEMSARAMILAMMVGPLIDLAGRRKWLLWWLRRRRSLGVAAFLYALLHLYFYMIDMGTLDAMLAEIGALGIWTGWVALLLFVPLGLTSNEAALRALRAGWKKLQRLAYPAAILTLVHWIFIHNNLAPALVHFAPLAILTAWRMIRLLRAQVPRAQTLNLQ